MAGGHTVSASHLERVSSACAFVAIDPGWQRDVSSDTRVEQCSWSAGKTAFVFTPKKSHGRHAALVPAPNVLIYRVGSPRCTKMQHLL